MKFVFVSLLLVAAATTMVAATPVNWYNCSSGPDDLKVWGVDVTPWPVIKEGAPVTVIAHVQLFKEITDGHFKVDVYVDGIDLYSKTGDICTISKDVHCPIQPQTLTINKTITVPSIGISASVRVNVSATDQDGKVIGCAGVVATIAGADFNRPSLNDELIAHVNSHPKATWKAGRNKFFEGRSLYDARRLMGVKQLRQPLKLDKQPEYSSATPASFDARTQWPKAIGPVANQADCGSCWAFGAVESVSDRMAIARNQSFLQLAFLDLVTCDQMDGGCEGGDLGSAWQYVQQNGLVTEKCAPYLKSEGGPIPTCPPDQQPCLNFVNTPQCPSQCASGYGTNWTADKHFPVKSVYSVSSIEAEIVNKGPVEAAFTVYEDFLSYKSGVYQHTTGQALGGHAIKIIGYGTENGTPYWMIQNSWTTSWGDGGYFKILRGSDECGIEDDVVAGTVQ